MNLRRKAQNQRYSIQHWWKIKKQNWHNAPRPTGVGLDLLLLYVKSYSCNKNQSLKSTD